MSTCSMTGKFSVLSVLVVSRTLNSNLKYWRQALSTADIEQLLPMFWDKHSMVPVYHHLYSCSKIVRTCRQ